MFIKKKIDFTVDGEVKTLLPGEIYCSKKVRDYYRDAPEKTLLDIACLINRGEKWSDVLSNIFEDKYNWLYQIITNKSRMKFFDEHLICKSKRILDIGAGWGQFSVPLAKNNMVCAVEPTPERTTIIDCIARQERIRKNLFLIQDDYLEIDFDTSFDVVLCIGVLEWLGTFRKDENPYDVQKSFLKKIKSELSLKGSLVIGIENRMGLKYLMGAKDDHTGLSGISNLDAELAKEKYFNLKQSELRCFTYSIAEYKKILTQSGFKKIKFYATFPDYKIPEYIFEIKGDSCEMNKFILKGNKINEHDGSNGLPLSNQPEINSHYYSLAEMGISHVFAPSFFIQAS